MLTAAVIAKADAAADATADARDNITIENTGRGPQHGHECSASRCMRLEGTVQS